MEKRTAGILSPGIQRISALKALLPEFDRLIRLNSLSRMPDAVVGWGLKPTSVRARRYAQKHHLPYIALEDGFLRSLGLGVAGYQPHSLVVDHTGIYYDATRPSDLENWLNDATFDHDELALAERCMTQLRHYRLSKYNHAPDQLPEPLNRGTPGSCVLVVDQTAGDASISFGGASAESFTAMLEAALAEHPNATVLVKVHPDVIAGKKSGHLLKAAQHPRCVLVGNDINPWALFDIVSQVYVVTSQLGFEALLAQVPVTCFGLPFYAAWGLTDDRQACHRRRRTRTLTEVFAAAYLRYARYANPYTGQPSTLEDTLALIADQKRQRDRLSGDWLACGFSSWKRGFIDDFLGAAAKVSHQRQLPKAPVSKRVLVWSSSIDDAFKQRHSGHIDTLWRMEDGFVRSAGLGVDLTRPLSLVIDSKGIYYDPRQPSDLEILLETFDFTPDLLERARHLRERLVGLKLSKYNVPGERELDLPSDRHLVLVPGQVESDASIAAGSPQIRTNQALLEAVRTAHPDAYILYKPHPDVISGARLGLLAADASTLYDAEVGHVDIAALLERVDAVHTMSSLTGFEALLRGRKVYTYGLPFYAGWGLTQDALHCPRRTRRLGLDALVAATLILYPSYVDPATKQLCNVETVVTLLEQAQYRLVKPTWKQQLYRCYRSIVIGRH
ncbi:capsular polysaccharide biosynthesis protein [Halomonas dongshanensis]|uniref:Capsular polysaccharide biosynthesis protein n=1 Tax=Halomonas dongshanensis TaxID=2890835 RepID=A0ABT2EC64_9GAMM|nr:capsular polysaccharide biosynthesis protein [Halomonas dongshanensis]MCS2609167.1 capsular polysaccharide biosynthesis protein [Halomonas dongshanensis]